MLAKLNSCWFMYMTIRTCKSTVKQPHLAKINIAKICLKAFPEIRKYSNSQNKPAIQYLYEFHANFDQEMIITMVTNQVTSLYGTFAYKG